MIELPEATVLAAQIMSTVKGKRIARATANQSPHKFAWYTGDPAEYNDRLAGKVIGDAAAVGCHVEIAAGDMLLSIGATIRYHAAEENLPKKHQLLLQFEDETAMSATAQMWGAFFCFPAGTAPNWAEYTMGKARPSPLTDGFDRAYFDTLFSANTPKLSAKAFLATEQRIPGLGNGALQDILWTARIHPKRKMATLSDVELDDMFSAVKSVLAAMTAQGGRDTECTLFGDPGGYVTVLSRNTADKPCPACGAIIRKEAYQGGSIYYCPGCQKL